MSRPFLRWAGGKQKLVKLLLPFVPSDLTKATYFEPFMGGGSLFFALRPERAVVSDINRELMRCYQGVTSNPLLVASALEEYGNEDSPEFYYRVRSEDTDSLPLEQFAARFIYLNKAAFNGIYRVNSKGQFNVPYGPSPRGPALPTPEVLVAASNCLQSAEIKSGGYGEILTSAAAGDFIYLDPPYPPSSKTAYFTHYSSSKFAWHDHERLAELVVDLDHRGCRIMISNADMEKVTALYHMLPNLRVSRLDALRWLGSNGDRFKVRELVLTNYAPKASI